MTAVPDSTGRQAHGNPRRDISAQIVEAECLKSPRSGAYFLAGARVVGALELSGRLIERPLRFTDCEFTEPIELGGTQISAGIHLERCDICSFSADRLSVGGDLVLELVHSRGGPISLRGARVAGHLRCTGSQLHRPGKRVFIGRGMILAGSALFDGGFRSEGEFVLADAQISGSVDMTGASFANENGTALMAEGIKVGMELLLSAGFRAEGTVVLSQARVTGKVRCTNGQFAASPAGGTAIDAQLVRTDEIWLDGGFSADGAVCLDGSMVSGRLNCNGGQFRNKGGMALMANGLECRDVRLGWGFAATGEVQLMGAIVGRELNCTNGRFGNEGGTAIAAGGLVCDGKIYFNDRFEADGEVQLHNARVRTEVNCSKGTFRNGGRAALSAGGLTCEGSVYLNETFKAVGRVELMDVTIGQKLDCNGGSFEIFRAERLAVGTTFDWRPRQTPQLVNLSLAGVGLLIDAPWSWPSGHHSPASTQLTGLTFRDVGDERAWTSPGKDRIRLRIDWLENASYAPGVYRQLASIYSQKGSGGAREISIAGQRERRRRGGLSWSAKQWNRFLDISVSYGYSLHRPLLWGVAAGVVGSGLFWLARDLHVMEAAGGASGAAANASNCTSSYPCFFPPAYAFEILLPVINLRQVSFWLPNASSGLGKFLFAWVWAAIVYGWLVSLAIAAGIGQLFSQRN